jgi:hypothetical protein
MPPAASGIGPRCGRFISYSWQHAVRNIIKRGTLFLFAARTLISNLAHLAKTSRPDPAVAGCSSPSRQMALNANITGIR